ncbi:uncharacterized protein BYT42DRAFT_573449 [Radiomyces spectabilis]|uniref:uncharacterized protein n=1 Tax=Radiomyces spectabilis TaxID=64574 RepID=UPI00221F228A|nr:uncharacterized protein BYT42DRAFT_573449 [Radiomyces spectabilis]KAI8376111.1 hypothetical protein BYT42DRAFT_573449 [Radiomyces spectabilis]
MSNYYNSNQGENASYQGGGSGYPNPGSQNYPPMPQPDNYNAGGGAMMPQPQATGYGAYGPPPGQQGYQAQAPGNHGYGHSAYDDDDDDDDAPARYAAQYAPEQDRGVFSSVLQQVKGGKSNASVAESHEIQEAHNSHQQFYGNGGGQGNTQNPNDIGNAAAMQALHNQERSGQGDSMNAFIGMAMAEASKLFAKQSGGGGHGAGGDSGKAQAIQQAAMMAMKLYMAKKASGGSGSGGSGGLGDMLGMLMGGGQAQQQQSSSHGSSGGIGGMVSSLLGQAGHGSPQPQQQQQPPQQQQHSSSGMSNVAGKIFSKIF